jgi:hypothetical protein
VADDFFPPLPPAPKPRPTQQPEWWGPPSGALGRAVPIDDVLLARSADVALVLSSIRAFSTGFSFQLHAVARPGAELPEPLWSDREMRNADPERMLRLGIEFSDGRRGIDEPGWVRQDRPRSVVLRRGGGRGNGGAYETDYWVWPLPPRGPLIFVCRWRAHDLALSRHTLSADPIVDAAAQVRRIWDA